MCFQMGDEAFEPMLGNHHIVIQQYYIVALGLSDALVIASRKTLVLVIQNKYDVIMVLAYPFR